MRLKRSYDGEMERAQPPKGWRWKTITNADGEKMDLLTTDMRTKEGKKIYKIAQDLIEP